MPPDLIPVLAKNKDVKVENIDPLGSMGLLRFNHLHPPFNNQKMRQARARTWSTRTTTCSASRATPKNGQPCYSFFTCGTPLASEAGAEPLKGKRDIEKAKALIKEAGYKGEKIVIIDATDQPIVHSQALVTAEMLRKLGLNVELAGGRLGHADHAPRRRRSRSTRAAGRSSTPGSSAPTSRQSGAQLRRCAARARKSWFGWPTDAEARGSCATRGSTAPRRRRAEEGAEDSAAARLRVRALHPDRAVHPADRVPHQPVRRDHRAGHVPLERREEVSALPR